jgi:starch synthase
MNPYVSNENELAKFSRELPQSMQERGWEIRNFMPRYGCINERRHQLHEVIRLSGMNIIVNDTDQPLIIKVASIPSARIQVYFIDNDEYFHRKQLTSDENNQFFTDNDERAIFFCKGVLETVKKLGWSPDIIHCHGWMTSLIPYYLKTLYKNDPIFADSKVVFSLFSCEKFECTMDGEFARKASDGVLGETLPHIESDSGYSALLKTGIQFADCVVQNTAELDNQIAGYLAESEKKTLNIAGSSSYVDELSSFYQEILHEESILAD